MDVYFPEFRDQNELSRYPFSDSASLRSAASGIAIPNDAFIDANVYPRVVGSPIYITQAVVESGSIRLYVGTRRTPQACWTDFNPLNPASSLRLVDKYGRSAGLLLTRPQSLAIAQTWAIGKHVFRDGETQFAISCCRPYLVDSVEALLTASGQLLTGEITVVAEDGVVLREIDDYIRVDVVGDPLFLRKLCAPEELFETPRFLQTINQVEGDEYGNLELIVGGNISPDTIVRINPSGQNTLTIEVVGKRLGS